MRLVDFQLSYNGLPQAGQNLYSLQIAQIYKEMQDVVNAKKINLQREQTIVDVYEAGVENKILSFYKKKEHIPGRVPKEESSKDFLYKPISKGISGLKKNSQKGLLLDIVI